MPKEKIPVPEQAGYNNRVQGRGVAGVGKIMNPAGYSQEVKGRGHVLLPMTQDLCLIDGHSWGLSGPGPGLSVGAATNASDIVLKFAEPTVQAYSQIQKKVGGGRLGTARGAPRRGLLLCRQDQE